MSTKPDPQTAALLAIAESLDRCGKGLETIGHALKRLSGAEFLDSKGGLVDIALALETAGGQIAEALRSQAED